MDNFTPILHDTLNLEGGYTVDNGMPTNRGVKQDTYDDYAKRYKLPRKEVSELKYGDVVDFYKNDYWETPKINLLPDKVSAVVFDYGVNAGTGKAIKDLQRVIGTKDDGIIGKKTLGSLNKYIEKFGEDELINNLIDERMQHYGNLVTKEPQKYGKYIDGWSNRINHLRVKYTTPTP